MNWQPFAIRFKPHERAKLKAIAQTMRRKESEAVRILVDSAYDALMKNDSQRTVEEGKGEQLQM